MSIALLDKFDEAKASQSGTGKLSGLACCLDASEIFQETNVEGRLRLVYVKRHYAKPRAGQLAMFSGISSPYEVPDDSEIICDTGTQSVTASARDILQAVQYRRSEREHARRLGPRCATL